ncbi:glycosyltransferase [Nocardioides cynanchi]|uniref:glycosyltransferase n=1 Tax=Nocardioides cynanchi TaxID=2558918 RepID=UPI00192DF2BD|nr:nucleotide disphospho-sugar-binding domain-containing protein [Nocardioides cynanchi]
MAEIVFVTWDGGGNVPPAVGIATELVARGHGVRFVGHPRQRESLVAAGLEVAPSLHARAFSALDANSPLALVAMFGDRGLGRDVLAALADRPADVVVVDCLLFGVMAELRAAGTPYVVLEHLYDAYLRGGWLKGPMGLGMRLQRLQPARSLAEARLRLVASLPSLDPAGARSRSDLTWVGPVVPVAERVPADPLVLVSLSTFRFPKMAGCLQTILDACAGLDARVVVTTGPVVDPAELRAPDNAEVHRFVPHAELMPRAALVIGHGGHGTTMQALAHDVPLVLMPMHPLLDQPMVARSVASAGAGRVVPKKASAADLTPVVAAMLADGPHREAAARLGAEIRALPGARNAADRIESLMTDGAPQPEHPLARP